MKRSYLSRICVLLILAAMSLSMVAVQTGCSSKEKLYVFNCGDYIGEDTIAKFEKKYPDIQVVYETFDTNEAMYQKLVSSNIPYDVLIPSDYMVERLIQEDRLLEIDMSKITNYNKIGDKYKNKSYDPENKYSVPYMWGTMGIIYNKKMVTEPVTSWDILWDEKYKGNILMQDSMRETMAVALLKLGYNMNTTNPDEINAARDALLEQKKLVALYGVDILKEKMINGYYALSVAWSGDAVWMIDQNPDLDYAIPEEGTQLWIDAMVIPNTSKNTEAAHLFIDFMCSTEIAYDNVDYIGYSTPQTEALEMLGDEYVNDMVYNPTDEMLKGAYHFTYLGDALPLYNEAWEALRISGADVEEGDSNNIYIVVAIIAVAVLGGIIAFIIVKKKRDKRYDD